jgi:hypothetical protein
MVVITVGGLGVGMEGVHRGFVSGLNRDGFEVVIVSWTDSWLESAPSEEAGPARLACRAATAILWVHDNLYQDLGVSQSEVGRCGFCLTGNSGGATQIAYALSFYGLAGIVDAAVLSAGPPHAAIDEGCMAENQGLAYVGIAARNIDLSYGFSGGEGACARRDQTFLEQWNQDSVDTGGVYSFPDTRIVFVFVEGDPSGGVEHGRFYLERLRAADTPMVSEKSIPGVEHTCGALEPCRAALEDALLEGA